MWLSTRLFLLSRKLNFWKYNFVHLPNTKQEKFFTITSFFKLFCSWRGFWIKVRIKYCDSINHRVPQGLFLGPLLFLVCINGVVDYVRLSKVSLFAENTMYIMYISGNSVNEIITRINLDLHRIYTYLIHYIPTGNLKYLSTRISTRVSFRKKCKMIFQVSQL